MGHRVDIINLSIGFRNCAESRLKGLREALKRAQDQGVVVFAATSNAGLHEEVAWPARDRQYSIGVHSCSDNGKKASDFNAEPSCDGENFIVVGENILSQWPTNKGGGFRVANGTSFSAPVASAMGALILQFIRQRRCCEHHKRVSKYVDLGSVCTNAGMAKVLRSISSKVDGDFWSISPKLFWKVKPTEDGDHLRHAWDIIEKALRAN
jgi:hypothetical protein